MCMWAIGVHVAVLTIPEQRAVGKMGFRNIDMTPSDHYNRDIGITFPAQLLSFRACLTSEIAQQSADSQFAKMLIMDYHSVKSTFGEVCTALLLFLTLP